MACHWISHLSGEIDDGSVERVYVVSESVDTVFSSGTNSLLVPAYRV